MRITNFLTQYLRNWDWTSLSQSTSVPENLFQSSATSFSNHQSVQSSSDIAKCRWYRCIDGLTAILKEVGIEFEFRTDK